jgi:uncharacterized membrane-anchored protein YhcB (DUF1043 family)
MQATIPTNSGSAIPSQQPAYQPSVPITVYRQLATELQNTKDRLANLEIENINLTSQNQALVQEFEAIASASQQIQNLVLKSANEVQQIGQHASQRVQNLAPVQPTKLQISAQVVQPKAEKVKNDSPKPEQIRSQVALPFEIRTNLEPAQKNSPKVSQPNPEPSPESFKLHTEEPSTSISNETKNTSLDRGLSGWWLSLTVICIVLISFGAGYLLMKPFANRN